MSRIIETWEDVKRKSEQYESVLVSYSDGKDSRVVMDLCCANFRRVVGFVMSIAPGLRVIAEGIQWAKERYSVDIIEVPHWSCYRELNSGNYGVPVSHNVKYGLKRVCDNVIRKTGIELIASGHRKSESFERAAALSMGVIPGWQPIANWIDKDVFSYMKIKSIPVPSTMKKNMSGVGMEVESLLWLHANYPDDFEKLEKIYPLIRGVIKRKELRGIGATA